METITVFGTVLKPTEKETQFAGHLGSLYLVASTKHGPSLTVWARHISLQVEAKTIDDLAMTWLETASMEAPKLCALVVDMMAAKAGSEAA